MGDCKEDENKEDNEPNATDNKNQRNSEFAVKYSSKLFIKDHGQSYDTFADLLL